jgi:hypothetical protein
MARAEVKAHPASVRSSQAGFAQQSLKRHDVPLRRSAQLARASHGTGHGLDPLSKSRVKKLLDL